jgi:cold shock CspA family protein
VRGTVTTFDAHVGLGEITDESGQRVPFHCVAIADGTRNIELGAAVEFELLPKLGRYEAANIRPA